MIQRVFHGSTSFASDIIVRTGQMRRNVSCAQNVVPFAISQSRLIQNFEKTVKLFRRGDRIIQTMNTVRTTVRWIVSSSLLLSLSMVSLYPRLMAADDRAAATATNGDQKVCCCGTEEGRCCGRACCQMPNPKDDKVPASPNPSESRGQMLGFVVADLTLSGQSAARFNHASFGDSATSRSPSLVALGIRLNT